jgi:alpha/beta superfamily hydrolase
MHSVEKLFILNNEIKLEAEVFQIKKETPSCVALMCHPHPEFFRV